MSPADNEAYRTTRDLLEDVRDMYEPRRQYRHRAGGGTADPLAELLRRFPAPGAGAQRPRGS